MKPNSNKLKHVLQVKPLVIAQLSSKTNMEEFKATIAALRQDRYQGDKHKVESSYMYVKKRGDGELSN